MIIKLESKKIKSIVREDVNKDAEELAISNDLASAIVDAIKSEFDAVNEYNDLIVLAEVLDKPEIAKIAHSIANEEKAHVGELQKALAMIDPTFESSLESGEQEVLDIVKESYTEDSLFNLLKKQGKTLGDMREYQYQRNIAKQLGVDLDKVDELILSGKGYEDISEYIYNNADKKEYKKVYHKDDTLEENLEEDDERELINQFYEDASLELIKEVIEEYDGSVDTNYLEHVKSELRYFKKEYETATKEDLVLIVKYDIDSYILDNYIPEYDKQEYLDKYRRDEREEKSHLTDLESDWRDSR